MDIAVATLTETIENASYNAHDFKVTRAAFKKDGAEKYVSALVDFISEAIDRNELGQANLVFSDDEIVVRLEINAINLPYSSLNPLKKMLDPEATLPVNVYSIIESPDVNVSHLRIDKVASADDFVAHEKDAVSGIVNWLDEKMATIDNHEENAEEAKKPKKS